MAQDFGDFTDAIAGKPAPTVTVSVTNFVYGANLVGAGLPAMGQ